MKKYTITKVNVETKKETDYGCGYTMEDIKDITKGYKYNGMFYERKGSKYIFFVKENKSR